MKETEIFTIMKKIILFMVVIFAITMFSACGSEESTEATTQSAPTEQAQGTAENGGAPPNGENGEGGMQARGNGVTGLVTDVIGNEITIQVGEMENGGMGGGMPEGAGGNMSDMTEEERAEMQAAMENGEMPEEMGERPEGMGERPEGAGEGAEGERPEGAGGQGGAGGMGGGMSQMEGQDYSEIVTLTDETRTFNVPVTTPVMQFGTEMTFSQITEDMYITVMIDDSDNVTSINILG